MYLIFGSFKIAEGRRKKEEGRRKKEEGRRKKKALYQIRLIRYKNIVHLHHYRIINV
ncbi:hypothetical protein [Okeania sp. SIO2B3]|uniref:hypothetical protein n=1 Tax=Okeania sp. SIO2B3 TaxID=2607784 RepID=UPI0013BF6E82|nr:hypothetical protein [Okeania sp. SIO2B3]NET41337.1 hypothetical protein [Okeania sp. SIO2B3]